MVFYLGQEQCRNLSRAAQLDPAFMVILENVLKEFSSLED